MKRCLTSLAVLLLCTCLSPASSLLTEEFAYPDGSLVGAPGSAWVPHSGDGINPVTVTAGRAVIVGGDIGTREDVSILLPGQPLQPGGAVPVLYASFLLKCTTLPNELGAYFAHFQRSTNVFRGRVWASTAGAAPGTYRIAIGNSAQSTATTGQFPQDLALNANYRVVFRYSINAGTTRLWINPATENSASVTGEDVPSAVNIERFGFRQGVTTPDGSSGTLEIDQLLIGTTFEDVVVANEPATISAIADQQIPVNGATAALNFTIGDDQTPVGDLTLGKDSNNQTLVPLAGIAFGGAGASRTVTVTPAANQTGAALITVTVGDGVNTTPETFLVTVVDDQPPTISAIANQQIVKNAATGALAFSIGDNLVPAASLTLGKGSDNLTLVPLNNIVFGGTGANRTVTVTPATDQTGTAVITVSVSDGANTTPTTFQLTVTDNLPPTISPIADRQLAVNGTTGAINFTIGDDLTAPASLTLGKDSNNQTLVPLVGITFGGSGANRTVTVTPAANQTGAALITVTVGDGVNTTPETFLVTVVDDQPPTISAIANQQIVKNAATGALAFSIGDNLVPAASLTLGKGSDNLTLVPLNNIVFGGTGANRTVTVTPATDQTGTAVITVSVSDGPNTTPTTFQLAVVNNQPPTITGLANQPIFVNTSTGPLGFTIGDDLTAPASLTLGKDSSNQTLVPLAGITFGGAGASRTVTVTPAANRVGSATITVSVNDGTATTPTAFLVTVTDNQPPTISAIPDQSLAANSSTGPVNFTISDGVVPAANLTLSKGSDNLTLVPLNNIVFGGTGTSRTVTVTPVAGQLGSAAITVTVGDGANLAQRTFMVTVGVPAIAPPANQFTPVNTALGPMPVAVSHGALDPAQLTLTAISSNDALIPDGSLVVGGSGANRTLTATPLAGQTGVTTITLTASDGVQPVQQIFTITVHPNPGMFFTDDFSRAEEGPVADNILWRTHGGTPGETQILLDELLLSQAQSEDFHRRLHATQTYAPAAGNVIYAGFTVNFATLPSGSGSYFAHLNTNTFRARVFVRTNFAAANHFRLGVANATVNPPNDAFLLRDLALNRDYQVVVRYAVGTGESRLWVDPTDAFSASVAATDAAQPVTIDVFSFRQSDAGNPLGMGVLALDDLKVGSTFAEVLSLVPVELDFVRTSNTLRLTWPTGQGFLLKRTPGMPPTLWTDIPFSTQGGNDLADIDIATGGGFFRLEKN